MASIYAKFLNGNLLNDLLKISTIDKISDFFYDYLNHNINSIWKYYSSPNGQISENKIEFFSKNRIRIIAINVLMPFLITYANDDCIKDRLINIYNNYQGEILNSKTKFVFNQLRFGTKNKLMKFAKFRQGLLHLYKNFGEI